MPPHKRAQLGQAIALLASPIGPLLGIAKPMRFAALTVDDQRRCLAAWGASRLPVVRTAYQAIRRLVLVTHYGATTTGHAIGYPGPFSRRITTNRWEGPLPPGGDGVREPVARLPIQSAADLPRNAHPQSVHRVVSGPLHRTADVVIIGSGAGGAVAAAELSEAGFEVVIVEAGDWLSEADFNEDEAVMAERLLAEGGLRATEDGAIGVLQGETVGGGTTVNWMFWLRTPDFVLEQWATEAGTEGMRPADLAPIFADLEARLHVGTVPDEAHSPNNRLLLDGAHALGWSVRGGQLNARGCVRCGHCTAGCRHGAKQSALVTWLPRAFANGATLYANAQATRIERLERDRGTGTPPRKRVHAIVATGETRLPLTIDAPIVIVSGGAIGSPALLQRSGLGGGGVGRFLRMHPVAFGFGVYDREIAAGTGVPMTTICDEHLRWRDSDYGFWIETPPLAPWLAAVAVPEWGVQHARRMRDYSRLGVLIGLTRDGAARSVSNGRVTVDRHGRTRIAYRLGIDDAERVRASIGAMARIHFAAGATEVFTGHAVSRVATHPGEIERLTNGPVGANQLALGSAHVTGSCRMGQDRATSVVTCDGEHHAVRGLYIIDGSVLPSAPAVNPQATIMAIATVLSRRLADRHRGVPHA